MRIWPDFSPSALFWSHANAALLARLSAIAYDANPVPALQSYGGVGECRAFNCPASDAAGYLAKGSTGWPRSLEWQALVFRGTDSRNDWFANAATRLVRREWAPGHVHEGFAGALDCVWDSIDWSLLDRRLPLWLSGHSLGGAMATLAAVRLAHEGVPVAGVYTFGAPRSGDHQFAKKYPVPLYRLMFRADIVPTLPTPLWWSWRRYAHAGSARWLEDELGRIIIGREARRCHREATIALKFDGSINGVADHDIGAYARALETGLSISRGLR